MSWQLVSAALITVAVETLFFALLYRRDAAFLVLCAALNLATNLALNLALAYLPRGSLSLLVYPLEALVVLVEYAVYAFACARSKRLFFLTLAANVLSYCLGLLIFGHV